MKRRTLLQSSALTLPSLARAQTVPASGAPVTAAMVFDFDFLTPYAKDIRDELARLGWREGANLRLAPRTVDARHERLDATPEYAHIAALARAMKLPSASISPRYAPAGGLLSYGPALNGFGRRALQLADQVLRGARVGEMPIEQPTLINLTLNKRTAREIGLSFPQELLVRADEVIE